MVHPFVTAERALRAWDRPYPEFAYSASAERRRRECAHARTSTPTLRHTVSPIA